MKNPKLENSLIIDCIPQIGECPLNCLECYYNGGRFYRTLEKPEIPSVEESKGKIVRVNSGHDSNLEFEKVMEATKNFKDKFYNTSLNILRFEAPTVLTINGRDTDYTYYRPHEIKGKGNFDELMFVRFRVNTWNLPMLQSAILDWNMYNVIVMLTDMRYYDKSLVQNPKDYIFKKHILNEYYCLKPEVTDEMCKRHVDNHLVYWCGNIFSKSGMCADCRLCEHLYWKTKQKLC